jgi:hypothetical protein
MNTGENFIKRFFGVIIEGQTYLNLLHVLLAFPLGLFYFIFLVIGLSVGISTIIIWIGLLILGLVMAAWWLFILFERQLAVGLLRVRLDPLDTPNTRAAATTWKKLGAYLSNPVTWKGLFYLFLKFPLGLTIFILLTVAASVSAYFITAPITYQFIHPEVWLTFNTFWRIDTLSDAMIAFVIGVPLLFATLHLVNGLAWISGWLAKLLLGNPQRRIVAGSTPASTTTAEGLGPAAGGATDEAEGGSHAATIEDAAESEAPVTNS